MGAPTTLTQDAKSPEKSGSGGNAGSGGGAHRPPTWRLVVTVAACTAIESTMGIAYIRGNMMPYTTSYIRNMTADTTVDYSDMLWVENSGWLAFSASVPLFGMLQKQMPQRVYLLLGVCVHAASYFGTFRAVDTSFIMVVIINGVLLGLAQAMMFPACVGVALQWFPRRRGLVGGITMAGFGAGAFIWNQIITVWTNPSNLKPNLVDGENLYFTQPELLDRVPSCYLLLGGILGTIQLLGLLFITFPPKVVSEPKADAEKKQKQLDQTTDLRHLEMKKRGASAKTRCETITEECCPGSNPKGKRVKQKAAAASGLAHAQTEAVTTLSYTIQKYVKKSESSRSNNNEKYLIKRTEEKPSHTDVSANQSQGRAQQDEAFAVGKTCASHNDERKDRAKTARNAQVAASETTRSQPKKTHENGGKTKRDTVQTETAAEPRTEQNPEDETKTERATVQTETAAEPRTEQNPEDETKTERDTKAGKTTQSRPKDGGKEDKDHPTRGTFAVQTAPSESEEKPETQIQAKHDAVAEVNAQPRSSVEQNTQATAHGLTEDAKSDSCHTRKLQPHQQAANTEDTAGKALSLRHMEEDLERVVQKCEKVTKGRVCQGHEKHSDTAEGEPGKTAKSQDDPGEGPNYSVRQVLTSRITWILWLNYLTVDFSFMFIVMFYKTYGQTFIFDDHFLSLVASFSAVFNALSRPTWGCLADKIGFLPTMLLTEIMLIVTSATFFTCELTGSSAMFFAWVCAMFVAVGGVFAMRGSVVSSLFGFKNFVINFGIVASTGLVSCPTAIPLARTLLQAFGWKGLFFAASGILSVGVLAMLSVLVTCGGHRCIPLHVKTRMTATPRGKRNQMIVVKL